MVRTRAMNSKIERTDGTMAANYVIDIYKTPFADATAARAAVRFERKLELGMEGHRFYDLVRWNTVQAELDAYLAHDSKLLVAAFGGAKFTEKHKVLPIPQDQIDLVGPEILIQNPGF